MKKTRDELITMLEDDAITVDDVRTSTTQAGTNSEAIQSAVDRV